MKILLLYNSNASDDILNLKYKKIEGFEFKVESLKLDPLDTEDFDTFASNYLSQSFFQEQYDFIILPFSFSYDNYMEYTGLRFALHIRLSKFKDEKLTAHLNKANIIFYGPDSREEVIKFSNLGVFLVTPHVYVPTTSSSEGIEALLKNLANKEIMSDSQYEEFLRRIHIDAPANYSSHHSIANEWAILRWHEIIKWPKGEEPQLEQRDFPCMLYYKYLMAQSGDREIKDSDKVDEKNKLEFCNKNFALIDDEYDKGWDKILNAYLKKFGAKELKVCKVFDKDRDRKKLIDNIENWIIEEEAKEPIDCYILDLRLCDEDFATLHDTKSQQLKNYKELTGHKISEFILKQNRGSQIVMFTASNKVWNLEEEYFGTIKNKDNSEIHKHIAGYILKESPEFNYSVNDTKANLKKFKETIDYAISQGYIRKYVSILNNIPELERADLDDFIDLMILDKDKSKSETLSSLILILLKWLEQYIEDHFIMNAFKLQINDNNRIVKERINQHILLGKDDTFLLNIIEQKSGAQLYDSNKWKAPNKDSSTLTLVVAALYYYYEVDGKYYDKGFQNINLSLKARSNCQKYLDFKKLRNSRIAHNGGELKVQLSERGITKLEWIPTIEDVKDFFGNVIEPILKKDFPVDFEN